jgi:hypothetical protein
LKVKIIINIWVCLCILGCQLRWLIENLVITFLLFVSFLCSSSPFFVSVRRSYTTPRRLSFVVVWQWCTLSVLLLFVP